MWHFTVPIPKPNYRPHWIPEIGALCRLYLQNVQCSFLGCPWEGGTKYSRGRRGSGRWPCSSLSSSHRGRPDTELTLRFSRKNHTKNNWILDIMSDIYVSLCFLKCLVSLVIVAGRKQPRFCSRWSPTQWPTTRSATLCWKLGRLVILVRHQRIQVLKRK